MRRHLGSTCKHPNLRYIWVSLGLLFKGKYMTEVEAPPLPSTIIGYKPATRNYLLQATGFIIVCCGVMYFLKSYLTISILLVVGSAMVEVWWKTKTKISFSSESIQVNKLSIPWNEVTKVIRWGPLGIPFTPLKYNGVRIYKENKLVTSINSTYRGFEQLETFLEEKKYSSFDENSWCEYPPVVVRAARYLVAFLYAISFVIILSFLAILILLVIAAGYFMYRRFTQMHKDGKALPEDAWVTVMSCLAVFLLFGLLEYFPFLQLLLGCIVALAIIWLPWKPSALWVGSEALFVGSKKAYPLRHLRTIREVSKFFIFKFWELSFANGTVKIYPFLENFASFKTEVEKSWSNVQKNLQGKTLTEEESEIVSPEEEALRLQKN